MLLLISPAKTLDFENPLPENARSFAATAPHFLKEAGALAEILKKYSAEDLAALMKISPKLAELNAARFAAWSPESQNSRPALFAFNGDVYEGLNAKTLQNLDFAQNHLLILCGLYGVLKPLDSILPYRLEMGVPLKNPAGKDLYAFWNRKISKFIDDSAKKINAKFILNLASNEYFKSAKSLKTPTIQCVFEDEKNGNFKIISFLAKRARGLMARFVIENKITNPADLRDFCAEGYKFFDAPTAQLLIFRRNENARP